MAPKILTGWVHGMVDGTPVSFGPGDPAPDWVHNPALITDSDEATAAEEGDAGDDGETTPPAGDAGSTDQTQGDDGDELAGLTLDVLKELATSLNIAKSGNKDDIVDRIRAKRAADAAESAPAGDDGDEGAPAGRAELEERARALSIPFDDDTTDSELEAFIESSE